MGFFSKILDKLGFDAGAGKVEEMLRTPVAPAAPDTSAAGAAPAAVKPIAEVDVVAQLEQRAAASSQKVNWRTSIVDLLKLLDIGHGRRLAHARQGCTPIHSRPSAARTTEPFLWTGAWLTAAFRSSPKVVSIVLC